MKIEGPGKPGPINAAAARPKPGNNAEGEQGRTMPSNRATIYLPENIQRVIGKTDQGELSGRIADIIDRYGEIMKRADRELMAAFTDNEIYIIVGVIRGTLWQPAANIDGGIVSDLDDAGKKAVADKVRGLTFAQLVALVERTRKIMQRE
jgi:hypothetical protein